MGSGSCRWVAVTTRQGEGWCWRWWGVLYSLTFPVKLCIHWCSPQCRDGGEEGFSITPCHQSSPNRSPLLQTPSHPSSLLSYTSAAAPHPVQQFCDDKPLAEGVFPFSSASGSAGGGFYVMCVRVRRIRQTAASVPRVQLRGGHSTLQLSDSTCAAAFPVGPPAYAACLARTVFL